MATITAEIDLDALPTDDLINELSERLTKQGMKRMGTKERTKVMEAIDVLSDSSTMLIIPVFSLEDQSKKEIIRTKWDQYTSAQFEERLA